MKLLIPTASALILLAALGVASATTFTVLPDGSGDYPTIQAAINASVNGDVVELGNGSFRGPGNRDIHFLRLITVRSQGGDPSTCVIDCGGSVAGSHYGFTLDQRLTSQAVLEGVTVIHAYGEYWACAIECASDVTIRNCVFRENYSGTYGGAGATCEGPPCTATFSQCWFVENSCAHGGSAVWANQGAAPRFENCHFLNNTGYACWLDAADGEFTDCVFSGGPLGGCSAVASQWGSLVMVGCTVTNFDPPPYGGTIYGDTNSQMEIENTLIAWNRAQVTVSCGYLSTVALSCSDIYGNAGGDWTDCSAGQLGLNGNICLDPQFCSEFPSQDLDWSIHSESPCAPAQSGCGLIGAGDVGCGPTPAETRTWGGVKLLFRK